MYIHKPPSCRVVGTLNLKRRWCVQGPKPKPLIAPSKYWTPIVFALTVSEHLPNHPAEEPPVGSKPPFYPQLGKPREIAGLPSYKKIVFAEGVKVEEMLFDEAWLLRKAEENVAAPACLADEAQMLARSAGTVFNVETTVMTITDGLARTCMSSNGAAVASK